MATWNITATLTSDINSLINEIGVFRVSKCEGAVICWFICSMHTAMGIEHARSGSAYSLTLTLLIGILVRSICYSSTGAFTLTTERHATFTTPSVGVLSYPSLSILIRFYLCFYVANKLSFTWERDLWLYPRAWS